MGLKERNDNAGGVQDEGEYYHKDQEGGERKEKCSGAGCDCLRRRDRRARERW